MALFIDIDRKLERWTSAGVMDVASAERIRRFESQSRRGSDVAVRLALALGGIMVAAGILLFVAAHWNALSPAQRFLLVLILTGGFHVVGGLFAERMRALSVAMHGLGTAALGAGIFLAGQIFNLQEHWPGGVMLWAMGAVAAWYVLRHSVQAVFAALLIPAWLGGEWIVRAGDRLGTATVLASFLAMLALSYLTIPSAALREGLRRPLHLIGGVALLPACITVILLGGEYRYYAPGSAPTVAPATMMMGWILALGLPLLFASALRRTGAMYNLVAAVWLLVVSQLNYHDEITQLKIYGLCAVASVGLIAWGLNEAQKNYIDVGVAGFALTLIFFYFSSVMDKLGRSFALITGGILLLVGGYLLEKIRRKLVRQLTIQGGAA